MKRNQFFVNLMILLVLIQQYWEKNVSYQVRSRWGSWEGFNTPPPSLDPPPKHIHTHTHTHTHTRSHTFLQNNKMFLAKDFNFRAIKKKESE